MRTETEERPSVVNSQAAQGSLVSIECEEGPVLFVENVQDHQTAVSPGCEDD